MGADRLVTFLGQSLVLTYAKRFLEALGAALLLLGRAMSHIGSLPRSMGRLIETCLFMGYSTAGIVMMLSFSIGAVLALQTGYTLRSLGVQSYIGSIVGLSMVRELGPVMTAIMVVGRIGSATTAELASMKIYREVDALITMNIPPERLLVMPRLVAIMLVMPVLTMLAIISGWAGGAVIVETVPWINLDYQTYFTILTQYVTADSVTDGLVKAQIFGVSVVLICCSVGLRTTGGPREIGYSVTRAVVASINFILISDYFVTRILL